MKNIFIIVSFLLLKQIGFNQSLKPRYTVNLPDIINETSGLEIIGDSIFITHNDSGDGPILYFVDSTGKLLKKKKLNTAQSFDWEDITFDGKKFLYIGDLGNNSNQREKLEMHRFNIFDSTWTTGALGYADQSFPTKAENKNYDVEAMAYYKDEIFLFTKDNSTPYTGYTKLYKYKFNEKNKEFLKPHDSIFLGDGGFLSHSVTAADFNDDETILAIITYKYLYLFYDFPEGDPFKGKWVEFSLPIIHQREAICFDSKNNLWMTDEKSRLINGGKLYKYEMDDFFNGKMEFDKLIGKVEHKFTDAWANANDTYTLKVNAELKEKGNYELQLLTGGKIIETIVAKNNSSLSMSHVFTKNNMKQSVISLRCYRDDKLIFQEKIESKL